MSRARISVEGRFEDKKTLCFFRWLLLALRVPLHDLNRLLHGVPGNGAGEQYVRIEFAAAVAHVRRLTSMGRAALVLVVVDADTGSPGAELRRLEQQLPAGEGLAKTEPVFMLAPKRNIETWIEYLLGTAVDEEALDYKKKPVNFREFSQLKAAAAQLVELISADAAPADCPPSLLAALPEFRRLRQVIRAAVV